MEEALNELDMALFEITKGIKDVEKALPFLSKEAAEELHKDLLDVTRAALDLDEKLEEIRQCKQK